MALSWAGGSTRRSVSGAGFLPGKVVVYQIVTDTTVATEHALDLIESADLNQLTLILAAAPQAAEGITGAFIQTVIAISTGNHDVARRLAELIAEHGNPSQREAFAIRLRAFASHQPNPAPALDIAEIIAPETRQNITGAPTATASTPDEDLYIRKGSAEHHQVRESECLAGAVHPRSYGRSPAIGLSRSCFRSRRRELATC